MFLLRQKIWEQLEARPGEPHLSAYFRAPDPTALRFGLEEVLAESRQLLCNEMDPSEVAKFLEPIKRLQQNGKRISSMRGSIGLFLAKHVFRVVRLPIEVSPICVVSRSFHIKPLLKWAQSDSEFYFLGITDNCAALYRGSMHGISQLGIFQFPAGARLDAKTMELLDEWTRHFTSERQLPMFLAGSSQDTALFIRVSGYSALLRRPVSARYSLSDLNRAYGMIRSVLRGRFQRMLGEALAEHHRAEQAGLVEKRLIQIARAASQGRVRKLFIAEDRQLWGILDDKTGLVTMHGRQLDCRDDDLLDELAETVLRKGGEVIVARAEQLPDGNALSAIVSPLGSKMTLLK